MGGGEEVGGRWREGGGLGSFFALGLDIFFLL